MNQQGSVPHTAAMDFEKAGPTGEMAAGSSGGSLDVEPAASEAPSSLGSAAPETPSSPQFQAGDGAVMKMPIPA